MAVNQTYTANTNSKSKFLRFLSLFRSVIFGGKLILALFVVLFYCFTFHFLFYSIYFNSIYIKHLSCIILVPKQGSNLVFLVG